jgi:hypothetical protein
MRVREHGFLLAIAVWTSACTITTVETAGLNISFAARGVRLRPDVVQGYERYHAALDGWGAWGPDADYGVHWCPKQDAIGGSFQPYVSRGHWGVSEAAIGSAPLGSPAWMSDDQDTWGEITTRHGWWVRVEPRSQPRRWCWVPGMEETPGRVVWRSGDGFVGWAPEAPDWLAFDDVDYEDGDWSFAFLGSLLEKALDQHVLKDEARETAREATSPGGESGRAERRQRVGPPAAKVSAAHKLLRDYADAHPGAMATASHAHAGGKAASVSSSSSSGSSSSSSSNSAPKSPAVSVKTAEPPLPMGMAYYDVMMMDPMMGPVGLAPRLPRAEPGAASSIGYGAGATRHASGGAGSHSGGIATHAASRSSQPSSHASSHASSTRSSSSSSSSKPSSSRSHTHSRSSSHSHSSRSSHR